MKSINPVAMPAVSVAADGEPARRAPELQVNPQRQAGAYADGQYAFLTNTEISGLLQTTSPDLARLRKQLAEMLETREQDREVVDLAFAQVHAEGDCEVDQSAIVSAGEDNGAYVMTWSWVDFEGTALCKSKQVAHG